MENRLRRRASQFVHWIQFSSISIVLHFETIFLRLTLNIQRPFCPPGYAMTISVELRLLPVLENGPARHHEGKYCALCVSNLNEIHHHPWLCSCTNSLFLFVLKILDLKIHIGCLVSVSCHRAHFRSRNGGAHDWLLRRQGPGTIRIAVRDSALQYIHFWT